MTATASASWPCASSTRMNALIAIAHRGRVDLGAVAGDDAARLELGEPRLHGPARDAELARDLEQADAREAGAVSR